MKTNKNIFRQLWIITIIYITYLLLGSFIVSKNLCDITFLIIFHILNTMAEIANKKSKINSNN